MARICQREECSEDMSRFHPSRKFCPDCQLIRQKEQQRERTRLKKEGK